MGSALVCSVEISGWQIRTLPTFNAHCPQTKTWLSCRMRSKARSSFALFVLFILPVFLCGCNSRQTNRQPRIEFNKIPPTGEGGPVPLSPICGRVTGAHPGDNIVVYTKDVNGVWWIQPQAIQPFIPIQADSSWESPTHLGTDYAALLVVPGYRPPATTNDLPSQNDKVLAVAVTKGIGPLIISPSKAFQFSGYDWKALNVVNERNGVPNRYIPENVSTDSTGALHLRVVKTDDRWTCSAAVLPHSFGYGTYLFSVGDISRLAPAAVLTLFTWDDLGAEQNHREMDVEISRWGDQAGKNAQFVVQPYYVPENVARFEAPSGAMTYSFHWEPGKVSFQVARGSGGSQKNPVATHVFSSGVPGPGSESVSLNFCLFGASKVPLEDNAEVVIDKFQYLP
jgi:hypothetical protein